jgi:hypothetical protein
LEPQKSEQIHQKLVDIAVAEYAKLDAEVLAVRQKVSTQHLAHLLESCQCKTSISDVSEAFSQITKWMDETEMEDELEALAEGNPNLVEWQDIFERGALWKNQLRLRGPLSDDDVPAVHAALAAASGWVAPVFCSVCEGYCTENHNLELSCFLTLQTLFSSTYVFAGHISDLGNISAQIKSIAHIDRLPARHSVESLRVLRHCLDHVDQFNSVALKMKTLAKFSYVLLLAISLVLTILVILSLNEPAWLSEVLLGRLVVGISLAGTFVASMVAFINPLTQVGYQ